MKIYSLPVDIKGLIFDIDATLYRHDEYYDSQNLLQIEKLAQVKKRTFEDVYREIKDYQRYFSANNQGKKPSMGNTLESEYGIPITTSVQWRNELLKPEKYLKADETLRMVLEELKNKYMLMAVTNNTQQVAKKTFRALGVEGIFSGLVALDHSFKSKPHPASFELAVKKMQLDPETIVSIGDRWEIDLEVPLSMGMGGILVESMEDIYGLPQRL